MTSMKTNGLLHVGKTGVFLVLAVSFTLLGSLIFTSTSSLGGVRSISLIEVLARIGQLFGLTGFLVIWYKDTHIFRLFGLGLSNKRRVLFSVLWGGLLGFVMQCVIFTLFLLRGSQFHIHFDQMGIWLFGGFVPAVIMYSCVALSEEMLFRGCLMERFRLYWNILATIVVQAALFAFAHFFNPGFNGYAFAGLFVFGIMTAVQRIRLGDLWFPAAFHMAWNVTQGSVLGFAVSGDTRVLPLIETIPQGNDLITGGAFGPEAGLYSIIALLFGTLIVFFMIPNGKKGLPSYPSPEERGSMTV